MGGCRYSASGLSSDTTGPEKDHGWNIRMDNIARKVSAQFRWEIMKHVLLAHLLSLFALTAVQHPSFDVASVKRNDNRSVQPALRYTPSGVDFARVPLNWIIGEAYQIPYYSQDGDVGDG